MIGNEDISKTLKMMHDAARYEFASRRHQKGIDILNDARILEQKMGFKNQAAETMLQISEIYLHLNNYDLAFWFAEEACEIALKTNKTSLIQKANTILQEIRQTSAVEVAMF